MTIKVNLLPTERKRFTFDPLLGFLMVIVILCSVGFVLYGSQLQKNIEAKKGEVSKVENDIKQIEQSLPVIDDLKTQIAKLENDIKVIQSLASDPVRYANLLAEVGQVLPENVWLSSLAVEPSTTSVTISGTAVQVGTRAPLATISALMAKMGESRIFADASLASTSQTKSEQGVGFQFQIEARYNPDVAAGIAESKPASASTTDAADEAASGETQP